MGVRAPLVGRHDDLPCDKGTTTRYYQLKNFDEGVRAGVPAAVRANILDGITIQPTEGHVLWGYVEWSRTGTLGSGQLDVRTGEFHRSQDFSHIPLPEGNCVCIAPEHGRWVYTTSDSLSVEMNYVGDGRSTTVYVLVVEFDVPFLPFTWHEAVLWN